MVTFTPSEFRADSGKVYNAVQELGIVEIDHRDRPRMLLMTEIELARIIKERRHDSKIK